APAAGGRQRELSERTDPLPTSLAQHPTSLAQHPSLARSSRHGTFRRRPARQPGTSTVRRHAAAPSIRPAHPPLAACPEPAGARKPRLLRGPPPLPDALARVLPTCAAAPTAAPASANCAPC